MGERLSKTESPTQQIIKSIQNLGELTDPEADYLQQVIESIHATRDLIAQLPPETPWYMLPPEEILKRVRDKLEYPEEGKERSIYPPDGSLI